MFLQKIILKNVAPIGNLELIFKENQVITLSGINGKGKTTVLSYVADAFFELAKKAWFHDVHKKTPEYYRVISTLNILSPATYSLVYLRFIDQNIHYDYIEVVGKLDKEEYEKNIQCDSKINFEQFSGNLQEQGAYKDFLNVSSVLAKELFKNNILTYFPSDRLEVPCWLNEIEYKKYQFNAKMRFNGNLYKNIDASKISSQINNWILDIILDVAHTEHKGNSDQFRNNDSSPRVILDALNDLLRKIFSISTYRFGVNSRKTGQNRLAIMNGNDLISPSLFHLSSGEISLLMLFAELMKQYDTYCTTFHINDIKGIVIVDEIDKHLHIKLQKEILPELINLFPNLQFIVSSHSPFLLWVALQF